MSVIRRDRVAAVRRSVLLVAGLLVAAPRLHAQERGAIALDAALSGLGTTARVLMIGAHPDDEDTQLIAWFARARHIETAYLSLTRGDGGQNLIGNQLGEVLGMIRTQELLAARRIDGGRQYFTRAFDFGFSKTLDETLEHWPKDSILLDMVAIVRAFRPHAIIAVWSGTPADGHGHHQFAGVLAREVYDAAADSVRFPASRVGGLRPWATPKFYRSRRATPTLSFNVGEYDPVEGRSASEIASISRSQHRSQGQGELAERGARMDGVRLEASRVSDPNASERGMFDGLDTTWARFKPLRLPDSATTALDSLATQEGVIRRARDLEHPSRMVAPLAAYVRLVSRAMSGLRCSPLTSIQSREPSCTPLMGDLALALETTRTRAVGALLNAAAVTIDATAPRELIAERDTVTATVSVTNQGTQPVTVERVALPGEAAPSSWVARRVEPDSVFRSRVSYRADVLTVPWWLRFGRRGDTFVQPMQDMVIGDDRIQDSGGGAGVMLRIADVDVPVRTGPIVYRHADPARGEVRRPIATVPEISVLLQHEVEYAKANTAFERTVIVSLHSASPSPREVDVALSVPRGARADSAVRHASLRPFGDVQLYFKVQGRLAPGRDSIAAVARVGTRVFSQGFVPVEFEHIAPQRYYRPARTYIESVNATFADLRIGYIRGVSDNVPPMLEELGLPVTELAPAALPQTNLSHYTTIVIGPRAYEANPALVANNAVLTRFVNDGGTIVTQYGQFEYAQPGILPYPITLSRPADRVTDERAAVRVIDPASPLLARPNKIGESDFAGWVQERSLYMPHTFDKQYHAIFSMNDKNDSPNDAAVLVAPVGKGTYVYTSFSFFRQLPAGNPGAARLFINLLSANQSSTSRPSATSSPVRP